MLSNKTCRHGLRLAVFLLLFLPLAALAREEVAFSPEQGATELIVKTIDEAKHDIRVAAYMFTSIRIAKALVEAQDRGVVVRVVMDKSQAHARYYAHKLLLQAKVPVRIDRQYAIMHDKFMIVDGAKLETGSFNFTYAAEKQNAENVIVLDNSEIIAKYARQWNRLWNESEDE